MKWKEKKKKKKKKRNEKKRNEKKRNEKKRNEKKKKDKNRFRFNALTPDIFSFEKRRSRYLLFFPFLGDTLSGKGDDLKKKE